MKRYNTPHRSRVVKTRMTEEEYAEIGGNLNQIARYLNEYGVPYNALSGEVRAAISDLAALKFEVLQKVGEAVGNIQTYQL